MRSRPLRVQATVRCLADNGRLLEIGKYDILKGTPLSMRPMLRNCAFEGIDLDRIVNDPSNITEVCAQFLLLALSTTAHHATSDSGMPPDLAWSDVWRGADMVWGPAGVGGARLAGSRDCQR